MTVIVEKILNLIFSKLKKFNLFYFYFHFQYILLKKDYASYIVLKIESGIQCHGVCIKSIIQFCLHFPRESFFKHVRLPKRKEIHSQSLLKIKQHLFYSLRRSQYFCHQHQYKSKKCSVSKTFIYYHKVLLLKEAKFKVQTFKHLLRDKKRFLVLKSNDI